MAALALTFISGCGSDPEPHEVCVDDRNIVVEDYYCDDDDDDSYHGGHYSGGTSGRSYRHYYVPGNEPKPRVGEYASGGSTNRSAVTRGGYGSSYRGGGG